VDYVHLHPRVTGFGHPDAQDPEFVREEVHITQFDVLQRLLLCLECYRNAIAELGHNASAVGYMGALQKCAAVSYDGLCRHYQRDSAKDIEAHAWVPFGPALAAHFAQDAPANVPANLCPFSIKPEELPQQLREHSKGKGFAWVSASVHQVTFTGPGKNLTAEEIDNLKDRPGCLGVPARQLLQVRLKEQHGACITCCGRPLGRRGVCACVNSRLACMAYGACMMHAHTLKMG
jgi:hypothetical protein